MKLIVPMLTLFLFAGCSAQEDTGSVETVPSQEEINSESVEEDFESVPEEELNDAEVIEQSDYPEFNALEEEIALETLESYLITDNPGTRVVVFVENGEQVYKSIYIKPENRLKLVDLKANELMIDEEVVD